MKKVVKAVGLALLLSVAMSAGQQVNATIEGGPSGPVEPFGPGLEVVSYAKNTGQLKMKFTITYFPDAQLQPTCEQLMMTMYPFDGLIYTGPDTLLVPYRTENPYSTLWELTLPPNDTSYLVFREECDRTAHHYGITFVTTGDSLETRWGTGKRHRELIYEWTFRHWADPREDYERAKREWEARQESLKLFKGKSTTGHGLRLTPEDSATFNTLSEKGKRQFVRMRHLERTPLTDHDREVIMIDGTMYIRYRGETKFHIVEGTTDPFEHSLAYRDSLRISQGKVFDFTFDLRDPADSEYVSSFIDSLIPTDSAGYYRAIIDWKTMLQLQEQGIPFHKTGWKERDPHQRPDSSSRIEKPKREKDTNDVEKSSRLSPDVIFFDGIEGAFPGSVWAVGDDNSWNGYDYWGDVTCRARSGYWSAWCSAVGDMPECYYYDYEMEAYMYMVNGVDLSDYVNVYVSYAIWYETEEYYDYIAEYSSEDGETWIMEDFYCGYSGGWEDISFPVYSDKYYLKFVFYSFSGATYEEGVFIDNIEITGDPTPLPDLTWDWPPFWDWPIVPSSDSGTNTVDTLYGGEPTYIDWSMYNDGEADAEFFHVGLYLDDVLLHEWYFDLLEPWDWHDEEDYKTTISTGYHTLKLWVDNRNEVQESDEYDNTYEKGFWWDEPEITYTGHVYYWDMNPPTSTYPGQYVTIKLWDKDGSGQQWLDTARTDQYGYFELGPVTNNNDTQDKDGVQQDIFFSVHSYYYDSLCWVADTIGDIYQHSTPTFFNHRSGVFDTTIQIPADSSGAFFVYDVILAGHEMCYNTRSDMLVPRINVYLDAYAQTEYVFDPPPARIRISTLTTDYHPETWDRDVILHEYRHRVADYFDFFFSDTGAHEWDDTLTLDLASTEAWADFFAAWVTGDPILENWKAGFTDVYTFNCENGEWKYGGVVRGSANNYGKYTQGAVAGILWDIFDYNDDDYSWWTGVPGQGYQDGIKDSLSNGIDNILIALKDRTVNGHHPDNIDEFKEVWFEQPQLGHGRAVMDIFYEHGELCCNTDGIRGDADGSGVINVGDPAYLTNYLFHIPPDPSPPCFEEGDADADGAITVGDPTYLIHYIFRIPPDPPPPPCP